MIEPGANATELGSPPPRKNPTATILWLVLGGGVGCCLIATAILFPVFARAKQAAITKVCAENQRALAHAVLLYSLDHDDRLPIANEWQDSLALYDPGAPKIRCPASPLRQSGYAFAFELDSKKLATVQKPAEQAMIFDSMFARSNAAADLTTLPSPGRHLLRVPGNNVTFADGHTAFVRDDGK